MIKLNGVSKFYKPDVWALNKVSLDIEPGEFVSIVGQSGTGKSTLAKILFAEEPPTEGRIEIGGWDITDIKQYEIPYLRRQIGFIFQDFKLLPKKNVYENISFAMQTSGISEDRIKNVLPQILKIVGLQYKAGRYPNQLSGGEQQRAAIARALVHQPKLLIADEPTGNLDSINSREIIDLLVRINNLNTTVILVTHNRDIVNSLNKRVITMEGGRVISDQRRGRYIL
ncbi:MAG TPA: ATP-binding cassette domain-containing protein [bacterium]|jgi:cell division transport system ATP-binding protein|nr:ATP-binding cassette domain-containing protein [bacterium]HOG38207.1 ATP-binding cassette domain-containing protein [bacterium]HQI03203.1 ATP-binding cassette domain-containing protein [bacterium]